MPSVAQVAIDLPHPVRTEPRGEDFAQTKKIVAVPDAYLLVTPRTTPRSADVNAWERAAEVQ
jgi:hypothetical protein